MDTTAANTAATITVDEAHEIIGVNKISRGALC